jgi:hypothetical protein
VPDRYIATARMMPALIVLWPISAVLVGLALAKPMAAAGAAATAALSYFLGDIVRGAGHQAQDRLWAAWGGPPTTQRLRWTNAPDAEAVARHHRDIGAATGEELPTREDETTDPDAADERYMQAIRRLIDFVAAKSAEHPHVAHELTTYGFRRNLYAVKPAGLTACAVGIASAAAIVALRDGSLTERLAAAAIPALSSVGLLAAWLLVVRPPWVRASAELYADRLLRAAATIARGPTPL